MKAEAVGPTDVDWNNILKHANPRIVLAADILKGWTLAEISEHGGSGTLLSVVNTAMDLADRFYDEASKRRWILGGSPNAD